MFRLCPSSQEAICILEVVWVCDSVFAVSSLSLSPLHILMFNMLQRKTKNLHWKRFVTRDLSLSQRKCVLSRTLLCCDFMFVAQPSCSRSPKRGVMSFGWFRVINFTNLLRIIVNEVDHDDVRDLEPNSLIVQNLF